MPNLISGSAEWHEALRFASIDYSQSDVVIEEKLRNLKNLIEMIRCHRRLRDEALARIKELMSCDE